MHLYRLKYRLANEFAPTGFIAPDRYYARKLNNAISGASLIQC